MQNSMTILNTRSREGEKLHTYKPRFYCLANRRDKEQMSALMETVPHLEVMDTYLSQLEEWVKAMHPGRRWTTEELRQEVERQIGEKDVAELGVWVYYPWKQLLVHLLDEEAFTFVRTNRNRNKITAEEQLRLREQKIGVIGLSVGHSIAMTLAMERIAGELRLADFDALELSNLNRIRAGVHELGVPKVVIAARAIAEIDPFLKVICYEEGITEENIDDFFSEGGKLNLVLDECDSLDVKMLIRFKAREMGIPVVMETSDRGMIDVERFDLEPERPIFHGLLEGMDMEVLKNLSNQEKIPHVLKIVGYETMSSRLKESLQEVGSTILTWPQLASSIMLGAASGTDACRRIGLGQTCESGRYYVDLEELVGYRKQEQAGRSF
ncbi:Rv1355c family protein [Brevibacillus panacihumi]|nr:Rv1355c family protein [Brevibacillus panacihumi]